MNDRSAFDRARFFFAVGLLFAFGTQVWAQTIVNWTKYDNTIPIISDGSSTNGKIPLGNNLRGDDAHTLIPYVLKDGSTYKMWYAGGDGAAYRVYYATSSNGLEWTKYDNTVPAISDGSSTNGKIPLGSNGRGDDYYAWYSFVLKEDSSTYKMWYSGNDQANGRIYYATSSNGLEWTKYDNNVPADSDGASTNGKIPLGSSGTGDDVSLISPFVIKDGSTYKMWYAGYDGANYRIYYATSSNGLEWTKYTNAVPANSDSNSTGGRIPLGSSGRGDNNSVFPSSVFKDGSTYKMWYVGRTTGGAITDRVYYATSPDGLVWTKYDNTIPPDSDTTNSNSRIGLGTAGAGDDLRVSLSSAIEDVSPSTYKMWYSGFDGTIWRIYHATAPIPPPAGTIYTLK